MKVSSFLLLPTLLLLSAHTAVASKNLHHRQASAPRPGGAQTETTSTSSTSTSSTSSSTSPTTSPTNKPTGTTSTSPTNTQNSPQTTSPTNTHSENGNLPSLVPITPSIAVTTSTDAAGSAITVTVTGPSLVPASDATGSPTAGAESSSSSSSSNGFGAGSIAAVSVAGGLALIGIIAFFVWKFSKKGFSDFDDNEAIKWPELNNTHGGSDSHALPVHNTGRAGFETGSEPSLSRAPSTSNYSNPDVGRADPYAVPPLPHMNPNQPYRDDPAAGAVYYDPYGGPVPAALEHAHVDEYGDAIPMTQMGGGPNAGRPMLYSNTPAPMAGRASPGPQAAYAMGRASPAPQVAYGMQPQGHQVPYGYGQR